jgi:glutathione S-transferase
MASAICRAGNHAPTARPGDQTLLLPFKYMHVIWKAKDGSQLYIKLQMEMMVYQLFYYPRNASWAPHMVLEEIGLDYQLVLVDRTSNAQKSAEYMQLNPTGRIPTLAHKELVIFESAAICLYLCEQHPQSGLIPAIESPLRAKFYQWLFYLNSTLQPELMVYFYPSKHTTAANSAIEISAAQEVRITEIFGLLNTELEGKQFLVGNTFTVCDCFLFMLSHWARGFKSPPLSFSNLGRYLRKLATRPSVMQVCAIEGTSLDAYY